MKFFSISETIQNLTHNPRDKERQSKIISRDKPCPLQFNAVFRKWFYCFSFFWYAKFCPPFVPRKYPSKIYTLIHNTLYNKISFAWANKHSASISFSGNGSKVIRVITTDSKLLARYTKMVFEKLLGKPYGKELDLLGLEKDSNPKESTCKGGIIGTEDEDNRDKTIVFKSDCTGLVTPKDTYANIKDDYKRRTVTAVEDFFKFVLVDMNSAFNFDKNFGVKPSSIRIAQEMAKKDLLTFLEKGISQRCEETEAEDMIEETFFYYPIKGVLNAISAEIYNELQQS